MTGRSAGGLATVSLRRRVTAATVAVFVVVLFAVIVAVVASFSVILNRSVTAVLNDHVQLAEQLARANTPPAELVGRLENRSVRARLVLADGQVLGSVRLPVPDPATKTRRLRLPNTSGPLAGAQLTLQVDGRLLAGARHRLVWVLLVVGAVALLVVAVGIPLVVRYALSPLDAMTRLARRVAAGRRGQRLWPHTADTELGRTAAAFDEMLDSLEGAERRALGSEEAMRRFVADAAHELRTPLAGISAAAEAVLQQPDDADPEARHRLLMVLGREARRAGRLVDDLLDLARIDTGLSLHPEPTDLRQLVDGQAERARLVHPQLSIRVDGPNTIVDVDPARIGQVVANLLNNACQVTPAAGTVRVAVSASNGRARVAVCDSGPGVAPADREQIFGRLVRLNGARGNGFSGSGLGLPIARGIARAHGGDVTCEPTPPGKGAVFVLTLPARTA
ncbi:MAG: HAMP domain-containing histidine kinase [Mycobacteriaceae bacterium]|nr:HAMP domain-containing histidine kinase [Mycobacteriaceae bacterium]MBV9640009.1 HAMP domain-containing histidine kinase [Mycobacteriaceae bacterium]